MSSQLSMLNILQSAFSGDIVSAYASLQNFLVHNYWYSIALLCGTYVALQSFAIPGPALLAVLMAALFGGWVGGAMSLACSVIGSSICYYIFKFLGTPMLQRCCKARLVSFKKRIASHKDGLFFYFLFLRVTPIVPNWFLNIASGNIGISFGIFFWGTMFGLIPNAIILATAGTELARYGEMGGTGMDSQRLVTLLGVGVLALLPIIIKKKFAGKETKKVIRKTK